jgi:hypothetical protein
MDGTGQATRLTWKKGRVAIEIDEPPGEVADARHSSSA